MPATLPNKYYLTHAYELFNFIQQHCEHLLDADHQHYLRNFEKLSTDAQCMLVRFLSRKPQLLKRESLQYAEIDNPDSAIVELQNHGYISPVNAKHWPLLAELLTKQQLFQCLSWTLPELKPATPKSNLVLLAQEHFAGDEPVLIIYRENYIVRRQQDIIDYILFIYFGDLKNRFQKFAMRDLGILKTRSTKNQKLLARFATKEQAICSFGLQKLHRKLNTKPSTCLHKIAQQLLDLVPIGEPAKSMRSKLLLDLGNRVKEQSPEQAISLWKQSQESQALEKWVRLTYQSGNPDALKQNLETLRHGSLVATDRVFIEDFYARKYQGKRTSVYTDLLREATRTIEIDEAFISDVEEGVVYHYQQKNISAYFTENVLWRALFAFTFWDLLFTPDQPQHSEFDRLPVGLKFGQFYTTNQAEIAARLNLMNDPATEIKRFIKIASTYYGYPTGLFHWTPDLLDIVSTCIRHAPFNALTAILKQMAMDYQNCKDGYPDLMIVEEGNLRFEEIKAAGDVLRPNQLLSIHRLRDAGFSAEVAQVSWSTDPKQCYAVVDIETTGGNKGLHSITEIAVVKLRNQKIIGQWSTLVNPQRSIPRHIIRLTGIDNHMVSSAPVFAEVADRLLEELEGCVFVAHNVGFDYGFIKAALEELNRPFHMPKYCTVSNSRKTFPGLKSYALGKLTQHFDIDLNKAHRALDDALATAHLLALIQQQRARNANKAQSEGPRRIEKSQG